MNRAIGDWLAPQERATALASSLVAVPLALAIGGPIVTMLLALFGWRHLFVVLGLAVLAWIPLWLWLFRDDPASSPRVGPGELARIRGSRTVAPVGSAIVPFDRRDWAFILGNRTLLANCWAYFVSGCFLFFFMTWLPSYLQQEYDMGLREVGIFSFLPWILAAALLLACGRLSDALLARTGRLRIARSGLLMATQLGAALAVVPLVFVHDPNVVLGLISLAVALGMAGNAAYFATTIDVAPKRSGTALGIMDAGFAASAFIAPTVTGIVVSLTDSFAAAFLLLIALAASSIATVFLLHHPDDGPRLER